MVLEDINKESNPQSLNMEMAQGRMPAANSGVIKWWLEFKHSTFNCYFALVVNEAEVFQIPLLLKAVKR
jgi:hypothetical protein